MRIIIKSDAVNCEMIRPELHILYILKSFLIYKNDKLDLCKSSAIITK